MLHLPQRPLFFLHTGGSVWVRSVCEMDEHIPDILVRSGTEQFCYLGFICWFSLDNLKVSNIQILEYDYVT